MSQQATRPLDGKPSVDRPRRRWMPWLVTAACVAGLLALGRWLGTEPLARAVDVLSPGTLALALAAGGAATALQAVRWRCVSVAFGAPMTRGAAVGGVYVASFLNAILPGGVAGDALRVVDQGREAGWRLGVRAVGGERLSGTVVVITGAAVAMAPVRPWVSVGLALGAVSVAVIAALALRGLGLSRAAAVVALSVAHWGVLVALAILASRAVAPALGLEMSAVLATACLAGMSIPAGIGGWGPREAVTVAAAVSVGAPAEDGFAVAAAYGILATLSTLPGAVVLLVRVVTGSSRSSRGRRRGNASPRPEVVPHRENRSR